MGLYRKHQIYNDSTLWVHSREVIEKLCDMQVKQEQFIYSLLSTDIAEI